MCIVSSVGTVLIFQFNPGFGTEASVLAVPQYPFWYLGFSSLLSIPGIRHKVFRGLFAFVSFWYWFGSISVLFWLQNQVEPKPLVLEPKLTGT